MVTRTQLNVVLPLLGSFLVQRTIQELKRSAPQFTLDGGLVFLHDVQEVADEGRRSGIFASLTRNQRCAQRNCRHPALQVRISGQGNRGPFIEPVFGHSVDDL